jgi:Ca2+-binding RTX toxin-like protein
MPTPLTLQDLSPLVAAGGTLSAASLPTVSIVPTTNPTEGGPDGSFTITLSAPAPAGGLVVNFTTTGSTATSGTDYSLVAGTNLTALTAISFTIAAGQTTAILKVTAVNDGVTDPGETVKITLAPGSGYTLGGGTINFASQATYAVGGLANSITSGDFNGDGNIDLVVGNYANNTVSILLGNASGGFSPQRTFAVGVSPNMVMAADFNGDGKTDLATSNRGSDNVSLLLGNGSGSFSAQTTFAVGNEPNRATTGDFNGDGEIDVVTANLTSNNVSVLLGNGSGKFSAQTTFAVGGVGPFDVQTADFNGDGKSDVVTANLYSNNVSILLGDGSGGFSAQTTFAIGNSSASVVSADFNNDGNIDLATSNRGSKNVSVLLGDGSGGFSAQTTLSIGFDTAHINAGDFNGDGNIDLVSANGFSNNISVLLGNGSGSFSTQTTFAVGSVPAQISVADFNGDDKQDLGVCNDFGGTVSVLLNTTSAPSATLPIAEDSSDGVILFQDNFNSGTLSPEWETIWPSQFVENGWLHNVDNNGGPRDSMALVHDGDTSWTNYTVSLTADFAAGTPWDQFTILFRTNDFSRSSSTHLGDAYQLIFNGTNGWGSGGEGEMVSLIRSRNFEYTSLFEGNWNSSNTPAEIVISAEEGHIQVSLNGSSLIDLVDPDPLLFGGIGVHNVWESEGRYDNFMVKQVTVEAIIGTPGNDVLTGSNAADSILGLAGADVIQGLAGADTLSGGTGNDLVSAGDGDDKVTGDEGADNLLGGTGNDTLDGGIGKDRLLGEAGNDSLLGNAGDDLLEGGSGNDQVRGGSGQDSVYGGQGADTLRGGDCNDLLVGGSDQDILWGGQGSDAFRLNTPNEGIDILNDFTVTQQDRIQLLASGFGGLTQGTLASTAFRSGPGAIGPTTSAQRLIYNTASGALFFDADGNFGGFQTIQIATLTNKPSLSASNIVVI